MLKWIKVNSLLVCVFSPAWVDAVWECEFTDTEPLDPAVEEEIKEDVNAFKKVYEQLLPFSTADVDDNTQVMPASERACSDPMCFLRSYRSYTCLSYFCLFLQQSVWEVLRENGVSVKSLVAVLACFVLGAKTKSSSVEQRRHSLQAASLYLLLLAVPGEYHELTFLLATFQSIVCCVY